MHRLPLAAVIVISVFCGIALAGVASLLTLAVYHASR